jgi:hypothetical protein
MQFLFCDFSSLTAYILLKSNAEIRDGFRTIVSFKEKEQNDVYEYKFR